MSGILMINILGYLLMKLTIMMILKNWWNCLLDSKGLIIIRWKWTTKSERLAIPG